MCACVCFVGTIIFIDYYLASDGLKILVMSKKE